MAEVSEVRRRRLVNPGRRRRRRNLSPLQKLFFGTKRQRAAVKANKSRKRRNISVRRSKKSAKHGGMFASATYVARVGKGKSRARKAKIRRKRNVGSIVTVLPASNPGRKRVIRRKRGNTTMAKRRARRRRNVAYVRRIKKGIYQYKSNPGRRRRRHSNRSRVVVRYRRRNPSVRRKHHYRRNPGMLTGTFGSVVGVLSGVAVTKFVCGNLLPAQFSTGIMGYAACAAVAVAQGKLIGKVSKNVQLGHNMMIGGLAYLTAKILSDFFPSVGSYSGISGMGLIGGSQFYVPQVNQQGSMGSFVPVGAPMIAAPAPAANGGRLGTLRRTGRMM